MFARRPPRASRPDRTEAGRDGAPGLDVRRAARAQTKTDAARSERPEPKPPKPVTPEYLRRAALHYLERYACSAAQLARVLARKVERRAKARGEDGAAFASLVDETVETCVKAGLVDDRAFAEAKAASLRRRGTSARGVRQKLAQKGVGRDTVGAVMDAEREAAADAARTGENGADPELSDPEVLAAHAHARRKRLGPYRPPAREPADPAARAARRGKELGAMARAGFAYDLARRVLDGDREG